MSLLVTDSPSPGLDAELLAQELWQINHSLVESLARLQVAIERDRELRARAEAAEIDSAS